jgi:hypothetical protein
MATRQSGLFLGLSVNALLRAMGWVPTAELTEAESASTLFRFFRSQHVRDLKLIFTAALFVFLSHLAIVLLVGVGTAVHSMFLPDRPPGLGNQIFAALAEFFSFIIRYIGPGIPIYGAIIGWAYLSASSRLGVVDLFASEIGTLCRVGTIFDIGARWVDAYAAPEKFSGSGNSYPRKTIFRSSKAIRETCKCSRPRSSTILRNFTVT